MSVAVRGGKLVMLGSAVPVFGDAINVFDYVNFSGSPNLSLGGSATNTGTVINVDQGVSHNGGTVWYNSAQSITAFTTTFTFALGGGADNYGFTFVIQNSNATTQNSGTDYGLNVQCASANGIGYGGGDPGVEYPTGNSVALVFSTNGFSENEFAGLGSPLNGVNLFIDGGPEVNAAYPNGYAPETDLHQTGINVGSTNPISVALVYDGTLLTMVLTDTGTSVSTRISWPVNIPAIVGANTAFIGFMHDSPNNASPPTLNSWAYWTGYNTRLSSPSFSVTPGQYTGMQSVSLSASVGASIYYTTNGFPPTTASTLYTGTPISVSSSQLIQAVAVKTSFTDSLVAQGNYLIQPSPTPLINFPSGFASDNGVVQLVGYATKSAGNLVLSDTSGTFGEAAGAWYAVPLNIASFNTTFTITLTSVREYGFAFVIQTYPQTTTGTNLNLSLGLPYESGTTVVAGGPWQLSLPYTSQGTWNFPNAVAIVFTYGLTSSPVNQTGLYTNGVIPTGSSIDMTASGVSLEAGNPLSINLNYNGTTLVETVTDTVTMDVFTHSYTVNIPSIVGASSAYVGFTAGTYYDGANLAVTGWTW